MVIKISYGSDLKNILDVENDNIDVFVELEGGYTYTVVAATTKNIENIMDGKYLQFGPEKTNYFTPGHPFIIVKKLTKDIIEEALKPYAQYDDGYWFKLYLLSDEINKTVF